MRIVNLILLAVCCTSTFAEERTLRYVITLISSGTSYPEGTPHAWNSNPLELTPVGIRQLYLLGRQLRSRYVNKVINEVYKQKQATFRSIYSGAKATATAAYAFAAGLYMPGTGRKLDQFQMKHAVPPVKFIDYSKYQQELGDSALTHDYTSVFIKTVTEIPNYPFEAISLCQNVPELVKDYLNKDQEAKNYIEQKANQLKKELYPAIKKALQLPKDVESMEEALKHREVIMAAKYTSQHLPYTLSDNEYKLLDQLYDTGAGKKLMGNKLVVQLASHGLLLELRTIISKILDAGPGGVQNTMVAYILNDLNLLAFLKLLNYKPEDSVTTVPYASSIMMEIYQTATQSYEVEFMYNGRNILWDKEAKIMPLTELKKLVSDNILEDFNTVCLAPAPNPDSSSLKYILIIVGAAVAVVIGLIVGIILYRRRKGESDDLTADLT